VNRRLTRAEFDAGHPCRGCGVPWQGNLIQLFLNDLRMLADLSEGHAPEPGLKAPTSLLEKDLVSQEPDGIEITPTGRRALIEHRREESRFTSAHGDCLAGRQSIAGSPDPGGTRRT
jgi:hypothetical protein